MPDYATAGQSLNAAPTRPLESLPLAVQRVNSVIAQVQGFIDRFHGPQPAEQGGQDRAAAPAYHRNTIEQLFEALDRLETRADALESIG